ncbi:hypothetical protein BZL68_26110 [Escherichia coli]|nr:hypothetical protein BZL68_26110 [Escherichia coli]
MSPNKCLLCLRIVHTCLREDTARRTLCLDCRKLAEVGNASVISVNVPVFCIHVRTPLTVSAY